MIETVDLSLRPAAATASVGGVPLHAAGERLTEITHWSAAGHAVVAAGMERELTALGWLAPPETP